MHEENISNIIVYFQQNPAILTEQLIQNALQKGYDLDDVKEALRRLGISPLAIPGNNESKHSRSHTIFTRISVITTAGIIIMALIVGAVFVLNSRQKTENKKAGSPTLTPVAVSSTPSSVSTTSSINENPITTMKESLFAADYKITLKRGIISGNIPSDTITSQNPYYSELIAYTKKGFLVRYENIYPYPGVKIYKDNEVFTLYENDKTYIRSSLDSVEGKFSYNGDRRLLIPFLLIDEAEKNAIIWKKVSDTEWTGDWYSSPGQTDSRASFKIALFVDPLTRLVHKMTILLNADTADTDTVQLQYDKIQNIDTFGIIPTEYKPLQTPNTVTP